VKAVTSEVHAQGLRMYSHSAVFSAKPSEVVNAGVDVMSHAAYLAWEGANPMPDDYSLRFYYNYSQNPYNSQKMIDLLQLMKDNDVILDATVWIYTQLFSSSISKPTGFSATDNLTADPNIGEWSGNITGLAQQMGVRVCAGTDEMGSPFNNDTLPILHTEMEILVNMAHFTPLQAITSATRTGAEALGIDEDYGTVEVGKVADLLILNADPSLDIKNTRTIAYVIKQGLVYFPIPT